MSKRVTMSRQTRTNWLIDTAVLISASLAVLSGIYFLIVPSGGFQGGRNAMSGVTIIFERSVWSDLHMWGGVLMIAAVLVHFVFHWQWVRQMGRRIIRQSRGGHVHI
jgi:protein-S-isoprenylcysteine O-methyltransferase Ste14